MTVTKSATAYSAADKVISLNLYLFYASVFSAQQSTNCLTTTKYYHIGEKVPRFKTSENVKGMVPGAWILIGVSLMFLVVGVFSFVIADVTVV